MAKAISIHALREEGDDMECIRATIKRYFYPRPPRGGRHRPAEFEADGQIFLSTPSARRATKIAGPYDNVLVFLSTPSARRATGLHDTDIRLNDISIHALREEGDLFSIL